MPGEAVAHGSPAARPFLQQLAPAVAAGALLHVALGRGDPSAVAGAAGIAALALALDRPRVGGRGLLRGALLGLVCGLAAWIPSAGFVVAGAREAGASAPRAVAIALLVSLVHAFRLGFAGLVATRLGQASMPIGLATASAYLAAEVVDVAPIPWSLGAATIEVPWLSAAADLGGPPLAGLAVALGGGSIVDARAALSVASRGRRAIRLLGPLLLAALVVRGMLVTRDVERAMGEAPHLRAAAVHAAWRRGTPRTSPALLRATVDAASREADVVVLPEAMFWLTSERVASDVLRATFEGVSADVLAGAGWGPSTGGVNAIAGLTPGAAAPAWYVKTRPFPLGESHGELGELLGLRDSAGALVRDETVASDALAIRGHVVAPAICWEDLFADAGTHAPESSSWIAAAVNDGWFAGSRIGPLHLQHARIRAVEARRAMVRATNEGATAIVDPLGGIALRAPGAAYVATSIPLLGGRTIAVRTHGAVSWVVATAVLAAALAMRATRSPAS